MLIESAEISSVILTVVALASVFAWGSNTLGTFDHPAATLLGTGLSEIPMLLSIQLLLLIAGMFLDAISIYFIFLLLLIPIAMHFNWDLVWFGVIITMNMALGQFHPLLGANLMVTMPHGRRLDGIDSALGAVDGGGDGRDDVPGDFRAGIGTLAAASPRVPVVLC